MRRKFFLNGSSGPFWEAIASEITQPSNEEANSLIKSVLGKIYGGLYGVTLPFFLHAIKGSKSEESVEGMGLWAPLFLVATALALTFAESVILAGVAVLFCYMCFFIVHEQNSLMSWFEHPLGSSSVEVIQAHRTLRQTVMVLSKAFACFI